MKDLTVKPRDVKKIIDATFPNCKKRKVIIRPAERVTFYDVNWCGGSRNQYRACTLSGETGKPKDMGRPAPWNNPYEGLTVALPEGYVIVRGGHFCGQEMPLVIYVHPLSMPKLLTN